MEYADYVYKDVNELKTIVELETVLEKPLIVYKHFWLYDDEAFYVLDNGKMYGVITPGDLIRANTNGEVLYINQNYKCIEGMDYLKVAKDLFEVVPNIHEIPIVSDECLLGIVKSGKKKTAFEWEDIRRKFNPWSKEKKKWYEKEIKKLLTLDCKFIIYPYLDFDINILNDEERETYLARKKSGYLQIVKNHTREEEIKFWGTDDLKYIEHMKSLAEEISMDVKNGIPYIKDTSHNDYFNVIDGHRIVPNIPSHAKKRIYMFGPCTILGRHVSDDRTIGFYLQDALLRRNLSNYEVVISAYAGIDDSQLRVFIEQISKDDIVIIMSKQYEIWSELANGHNNKLVCMDSLNDVYKNVEHPLDCILEHAMHCNYKINKIVADQMYLDIHNMLTETSNERIERNLQNYVVSWDVVWYYKRHFLLYNIKKMEGKRNGAIVMNCNPFTKGHRYLIEESAKKVENLYVLVVQEDKSAFTFEERFKMVKEGTKDLNNVYVIPSGEYIISSKTFEQYFRKEQVDVVESMEYDVHIFGEVVAKELSISYRFVGSEPYDKVTAEYNQTLQTLLPAYGVQVIELPRKKDSKEEIISASKVRKYLEENNRERLRDMLPESTLYVLRQKEKK